MESYRISGVLHERLPDVTFSSGGRKAEFVIETLKPGKDGKEWRDFIKFEVIEKFITILNNLDVGDKITVEFSVGGRRWKPEDADEYKYFTTLKAWGITDIVKASGERVETSTDIVGTSDLNPEEHDDLPF